MRRWLYSTNAKDIGTLYIIFAIIAGLIGTSMSMVMRMELGGAGNNIISREGLILGCILGAVILAALIVGIYGVCEAGVPCYRNYSITRYTFHIHCAVPASPSVYTCSICSHMRRQVHALQALLGKVSFSKSNAPCGSGRCGRLLVGRDNGKIRLGLKGGRRYYSNIISDRLLGGVEKVKYMVVTVLLGVLGVFIIYLLLINKIGIDVRTSLILSIIGIGIYMIWLLGTEGGKRWMERVGEGYFSSIWYEIMRDPEGGLLPPRYEYLRVSLMNKGFLWLLISYVVLRNIMKNMSLTGLDGGLIKLILLLGNTVSMVYMLMMLFKTGVMGREYVMKVIRGDYVMLVPGSGGPGGKKPNRKFMWGQVFKEAGRVMYQAGRSVVTSVAAGATLGMSIDWYGENTGKGKVGSNVFREGLRAAGIKGVPAPEYPEAQGSKESNKGVKKK